tara:strand:+ start:1002 stop:1502 length:501 start_codon:yes stop_codon:yes gene_type:complete
MVRRKKPTKNTIECTCCCIKYIPKKIVHSKHNHYLCKNCFNKFNGCFYCNPSISQKKKEDDFSENDDIIRGYLPSPHLIPIEDIRRFLPMQVIRNHFMIHSIIIYLTFFGTLIGVITNYFEISHIIINLDDIGKLIRESQYIIFISAFIFASFQSRQQIIRRRINS